MAQPYGLRQPVQPVVQQEPELNEFQKGFRRFTGGVSPTIDRTQATVQQALGFDEAAQQNLREAREAELAAQDPALAPRVGRVEDIRTDGVGNFIEDAGSFAGSVLGENAPLLGSMAVGGIGGGMAARALGAGARTAKAAGWTGAAAPYEATSIAESSRDIMDNPNATGTPQEQALGVLGTGTAKTALGMLPFGAGAKMLRGPGGRLAKGSKIGATSAASEGLTEVGEEMIGQFGESLYVPGTEMFDEQARSDYLNAGVGGALLGGPMGFGAGVLAPKGLSRAAENAMQTAVEEGKSPIEGANQFVADNNDLFTDEELMNLGADIEGFQPQPPRGTLARRMAKMEADEDLDLAFNSIFGEDKRTFSEKRKAAEGEYKRKEAERLATSVASGKVPITEPEIAQFAEKEPELFREAINNVFEAERGGAKPAQQMSAEEQADLGIEEPGTEFRLNAKGLPWHVDKVQDAVKVARKNALDALTAEQRTEYERSTGKDRERLDKEIDKNVARPVTLRAALLQQAREDGATDVNQYMQERVTREILPALAEAEKGTEQYKLFQKYQNNPTQVLDDFGLLAQQRSPAAMDTFAADVIKPEEMEKKAAGDMKQEAGIRRLNKDIKILEDVFENWNLNEEATTEVATSLDTLRKDRGLEKYKKQGVIHGRNANKTGERIAVEVFDFDKKQWVERQMNPMAAAVKAQRSEKYDPQDEKGSLMRQILEGISSVLGSRKFEAGDKKSAIRLTKEGIDPMTVVFKSKTFGEIQWKDVEKWAKTKDTKSKPGEKTDLEEYKEQAPGTEGEELNETSQPAPKDSPTTGVSGLAKDLGPYDFAAEDEKIDNRVEIRNYASRGLLTRLQRQLERTTDPEKQKKLAKRVRNIIKVREENIENARNARLRREVAVKSGREPTVDRKKEPQSSSRGLPEGKDVKPRLVKGIDFSEIPAKDKTRVDALIEAHSSQRQNRHQRLATKLSKQLGIPVPRILDAREAVAIMVATGHGNRITRKSGFMTRKAGKPVIYVNPTLNEDAALEVLGHEIGHVVLDETWKSAPRKVKNAVKADFEAYLKRVGADPSIYDVISNRTPQRLLEYLVWGDVNLDQKISELPKDQQKYMLEFKEWFADNVAKWIVTDAKPRTLVQQFFKHVADTLKDLWSGLTRAVNTPEKSIQEYMDRVFTGEPEASFGPEHAFAFSDTPGKASDDAAAAAASVHGSAWYNSDENVIRKAMSELLTAEEMNILGTLSQKDHIRRQLYSVYGADAEATNMLDEYKTHETIVLMFKAWRAGDLRLTRKQESIFVRFVEALAEILGVLMKSKQGERMMVDIANGAIKTKETGRTQYLQTRVNETAIQQARQVVEKLSDPAMKWVGRIAGTADMRVRWADNAALTEMWKQIYLSSDTAGGREGFFAATRSTRAKYERKMHNIFDGRDSELSAEVVKILNKEIPLEPNTEAGKVANQVYGLLQEIYKESLGAGVKMGDLGENYYPRVYDMDMLVKNRDEFVETLSTKYEKELKEYYDGLFPKEEGAPPSTKTPKEIAEFIHRNLTTHQGDEMSAIEEIQREVEDDPLGWPAMDATKARSLSFLKDEDIAQFMSQDLGLTLSTYIYQSAKRMEYNRRFGAQTGRKMVTKYLEEAEKSGASEADLKMAHNAIKAALGTLGADINPTFHKFQGVIMVLENWMLLGLATLTSLVDPVGIAVRGDLETAWSALKQGLKEVKAAAKGDQTTLSGMASILGINELHNTVEALGYEYGGYYVTGAARKWNEKLFSWNLLTQWTRMTRTMALAGAQHFIAKHANFDYDKNSERFMQELGLRKGDVKLDKDGNVLLLHDVDVKKLEEQSGKAEEELKRDARVKQALNRWVDEAILRPDAAQRPIWASDPHWMLVFHLKAFIYSFHERILKRVGSEIMQGNYKPAVMLMGYLPMMFIAEALRNLIQGDDMDEDVGGDAGFFETSHYLAQRAGLYGLGQYYFDMKQGSMYGDTPFSVLGGPSVEHVLSLGEAAFTESTSDDKRVAIRSLPFHNAWKDWFK